MSFDYRAEPVKTSPRAIVAFAVIGAALTLVCAVWVFWPMVTDASRQSATGTIQSYSASLVPSLGTTVQYRPTIVFTVDGTKHTFAPDVSVTRPDARSMPPGTTTTVRYAPDDPSDAVWVPGGTAVAANWIGIAGLVLGILLVAVAILLRALNRVRAWRRSEDGVA